MTESSIFIVVLNLEVGLFWRIYWGATAAAISTLFSIEKGKVKIKPKISTLYIKPTFLFSQKDYDSINGLICQTQAQKPIREP